MYSHPLFSGLISDEYGQPVNTVSINGEPFYIVNDAGFLRHIPAADVDRQVFDTLMEQIRGHEDIIIEQAQKMLNQEDNLFSRAVLLNQLKNMDKQFEALKETGIPDASREYLGLMGFKVKINIHGEVLSVDQPGQIPPPEDE
ncbi:hypothetical protein [Leptolinea tardivitalis]|uniref:Uncharacterized protein n=1 Tax=Leptolinea tardivitalis TaxID=229920 RepID=A0A0P6X042_9CHLR|nr:hypothetical protein [Leptolinea tardivitalis]KPL72510.1 hypothetical protein ADM99_05105 [Leptolinea tardivitalis]GAP21201.1 hypothetical protein LTAR_01411 [Leptolinea tardivitalis]